MRIDAATDSKQTEERDEKRDRHECAYERRHEEGAVIRAAAKVMTALVREFSVQRDKDGDRKHEEQRLTPVQRDSSSIRPAAKENAADGNGVETDDVRQTSESIHRSSDHKRGVVTARRRTTIGTSSS